MVARNFRPGLLRRGQVLVAGAGPVSNFLLALLFTLALFVALRVMAPSGTAETAARILIAGVIVNVGLGVFNLVPLPPLDGAWVASFGLPPRMGESYDRVVRPYGTWILLILVLSGALSAITSPVIGFLIRWLYQIALP